MVIISLTILGIMMLPSSVAQADGGITIEDGVWCVDGCGSESGSSQDSYIETGEYTDSVTHYEEGSANYTISSETNLQQGGSDMPFGHYAPAEGQGGYVCMCGQSGEPALPVAEEELCVNKDTYALAGSPGGDAFGSSGSAGKLTPYVGGSCWDTEYDGGQWKWVMEEISYQYPETTTEEVCGVIENTGEGVFANAEPGGEGCWEEETTIWVEDSCSLYKPYGDHGNSAQAEAICDWNAGKWGSGDKSRSFSQYGSRWWDSWDEMIHIPYNKITIVNKRYVKIWTNYYDRALTLNIPCAAVERRPYPRALVGEPNQFEVLGGTYTDSVVIPTCTPDIRNYKFSARVVPVPDMPPLWIFDERPFNIPNRGNYAYGWVVQHIFETASYNVGGEKPRNGPSLTGDYLSAYQVEVTIPYLVQVSRDWDNYYGEHFSTGWETVPLTSFGHPVGYVIGEAKDVTPPPPGAPEMRDYPCVVPVPVIESQSLIAAAP